MTLSFSMITVVNFSIWPIYCNYRQKKSQPTLQRSGLSLQGERASERRRKEESPPENIYDTPKTTSVKWKEDLAAAYDIVSKGSRNGIVSAVNLQIVPADGEDTDEHHI